MISVAGDDYDTVSTGISVKGHSCVTKPTIDEATASSSEAAEAIQKLSRVEAS